MIMIWINQKKVRLWCLTIDQRNNNKPLKSKQLWRENKPLVKRVIKRIQWKLNKEKKSRNLVI